MLEQADGAAQPTRLETAALILPETCDQLTHKLALSLRRIIAHDARTGFREDK